MAKQAVKAKIKKTSNPKKVIIDPLINIYNGVLDDIERSLGIQSEGLDRHRLSTGILVVDLMLGGGLVSGMITFAGGEASAKSTTIAHIIGSAIANKIPIIKIKDPEGSTDPDYTGNIWKVKKLEEVLGKRNDTGWDIIPKARYSSDNSMETAYNDIAKTLHRLPDKLYRSERKQWFLVLKSTDKRVNQFSKVLGKPDSKLSAKGMLWFPTDNYHPQAIFTMDSYPAFLPDSLDEKEDSSNAMAQQAREYSKQLHRVVGLLRRKQAIIAGVNQIRLKPGVMFGPSEYEPNGEALKFYSYCRNWVTQRATPLEWRSDSKISSYSEEKSVEGEGIDQYQYKHMKNKKNKAATPFLECWTRVWVRDRKGQGRGFCPVFDTAQFLFNTGLAKRARAIKGEMQIEFIKSENLPRFLTGKTLGWYDFKTLIIAEEYKNPKVIEAADKVKTRLKHDPKFKLRKHCFKLMTDGIASGMMNDKANNKNLSNDDDDLEG